MSATEVIEQIDKLPSEEQREVFVFLARKMLAAQDAASKPWLGKRLSFEQACDVVFRENRELDLSNRPWLRPRTRSTTEAATCSTWRPATLFTWRNRKPSLTGTNERPWAAAMVFLAINGVYVQPPKWQLYVAMIDVAKKRLGKADLAAIFRKAAERSN